MNVSDIAALKGSELKAKAAELEIKGRSKMTAEELRKAITITLHGYNESVTDAEQDAEDEVTESFYNSEIFPAPVAVEPEKWEVVPNREERRKAARRQRKARGRIAQKNNRQN